MKRSIFFVLSTAAVLFVASCNKNAVNPEETPGGAPESFEAYIDENPATKMTLDTAGLTFAWDENDQIAVNGAVYQREGTTNTFKYYSGRYVSTNPQLGCYPASLYDAQTTAEQGKPTYDLPSLYTIENFDSPVNYVPMAGLVTEGSKIYFTHLCAVVRVNLRLAKGYVGSLTKVSLVCDESGTYLNGKITAVFDKEGGREVKILEGRNVVTVSLNNPKVLSQSEAVSLYLPVFLVNDTPSMTGVQKTFAANTLRLKIEGQDADGKYICYGKQIDREVTMKRGGLVTVNAAVEFSKGCTLSGSGTTEDPYLIKDEWDLSTWINQASKPALIETMSQACYKLAPKSGKTITVSTQLSQSIGGNMIYSTDMFKNGLTPGTKGVFSGVLDGNGCTLEFTGTNKYPLFYAMHGAVIKDLKLIVNTVKNTKDIADKDVPNSLSPVTYYSEGTHFVSVIIHCNSIVPESITSNFTSAFGRAVDGTKIIGSFEQLDDAQSYSSKYWHLYNGTEGYNPQPHPGVDYADCRGVFFINIGHYAATWFNYSGWSNEPGKVESHKFDYEHFSTEVPVMQDASKAWKKAVSDSTALTEDAKTRLTPHYMLKYDTDFQLTDIQ